MRDTRNPATASAPIVRSASSSSVSWQSNVPWNRNPAITDPPPSTRRSPGYASEIVDARGLTGSCSWRRAKAVWLVRKHEAAAKLHCVRCTHGYYVRTFAFIASLVSLAGEAVSAQGVVSKSIADSLTRLDPLVQADSAIARGDLRYLAVCGYVCFPPGVPLDSIAASSDSLSIRQDSTRHIPGTSDHITDPEMARLNRIASDFAFAYNRRIVARRRQVRSRSGAPNGEL